MEQHARAGASLRPSRYAPVAERDVLEALAPDVADLFEQLRAAVLGALALRERLDLRALRVGDDLPLAARTAELDHRLERGLVQRLALERAAEARPRPSCRRRSRARRRRAGTRSRRPDRRRCRCGGARGSRDSARSTSFHCSCAGLVALVRLRLGHQHVREADRGLEALGIRLDREPVVARRLLGAMQLLVRLAELRLAAAALVAIESPSAWRASISSTGSASSQRFAATSRSATRWPAST